MYCSCCTWSNKKTIQKEEEFLIKLTTNSTSPHPTNFKTNPTLLMKLLLNFLIRWSSYYPMIFICCYYLISNRPFPSTFLFWKSQLESYLLTQSVFFGFRKIQISLARGASISESGSCSIFSRVMTAIRSQILRWIEANIKYIYRLVIVTMSIRRYLQRSNWKFQICPCQTSLVNIFVR